MNQYVAAIQSWVCPSDNGDPNYGAKDCFLEYGNSDCTQWASDPWGVKRVNAQPGGKPLKGSEVAVRPTTKIILGDWIWENAEFDPAQNLPCPGDTLGRVGNLTSTTKTDMFRLADSGGGRETPLYQLKITLRDCKPPIRSPLDSWRHPVIRVPRLGFTSSAVMFLNRD